MSDYNHGDGTFDLKIHAVVVWGGGNLYNLDEMEREMIFYKTMKKIFSYLFSIWESVYHLIVTISVELPIYSLSATIDYIVASYRLTPTKSNVAPCNRHFSFKQWYFNGSNIFWLAQESLQYNSSMWQAFSFGNRMIIMSFLRMDKRVSSKIINKLDFKKINSLKGKRVEDNS